MNVKFATWGDGFALRVPNTLIEQLGVSDGSMADMRVEYGRLVVTPTSGEPTCDLDELLAMIKGDNLHGEVGTGGAVGGEFR